MPDVKYVCLSDMHLGAQNSLLSNLTTDCSDTDPRVASPILVQLIECLRSLISQNEGAEKPTLILNGDILELALTSDNEAAMAFERFIEQIFPATGDRLFDKIVYLPGNHDHHLWETAREAQYVQFITHNDAQKQPGSLLKVPWHTTKMFEPGYVPSTFLEGIIHRYPHLSQEQVYTAYPNYALVKDDACALFSHGHFIESMYMMMSNLRCWMFPKQQMPCSVYDIESQNFAWIDFFWSTMGRSGEVGVDVERVYDALQSDKAIEQIADNIAEAIDKRIDFWGPDWGTKKLLSKLLSRLLLHVAQLERSAPSKDLSAAGWQGLRTYLEGAVLNQIKQEKDANIPPHFSFIFGHTHTPFQTDMMDLEGYHPGVHIYNTGGWVVDTTKCQEEHGGAVILLDENLNATSLRMYNEAEREEDYAVKVQAATHPNASPNPFHERISGLVDPAQNPWKLFSELVAKGVPMRYENLRQHIKEV